MGGVNVWRVGGLGRVGAWADRRMAQSAGLRAQALSFAGTPNLACLGAVIHVSYMCI